MDMTPEGWALEQIEWNKRIIDDTLSRRDRFDTLVANVILGTAARSITLYSLVLNDNEEARKWSGKTVVCYGDYFNARKKRYGTGTWRNEAGMRQTMLRAAIFSCDPDAIDTVARACLSMDSGFIANYRDLANLYWYNQTVSHLVLGDDENARTAVKGVNGLIYDRMENGRTYDPPEQFFGLMFSLEGILKGNKKMVRKGLRSILGYHDSENHVDVVGPADCMVCIPATLQIKLAMTRGLSIRPDDIEDKYRKYIPRACLNM